MKKTKINIYQIISVLSLTGFILSTAVLLYPVVSDRWNRHRDLELINDYIKTVENGDRTVYDMELQKAMDYNEFLYSEGRNIVTDAEYEPDAYYEELLSAGDIGGIMCYIEIPSIDVTEPVYHYSTEISLGEGVGHIHGSSLPTGGVNTHSVLTGHRGLPNQKFFSDLDKVKTGDNFYIHILGNTLAYKVVDIKIIVPTDVDALMIEEGRDLITLVTCEPYGVNTHRLLVTGERFEFDDSKYVKDGFITNEKHKVIVDPAVWVFVGFMTFILVTAIIVLIGKIYNNIKIKKLNE